MPPASDPKNAASAEAEVREPQNVDKIRDILFGANMRDYEKRFGRLEDRLTRDAESFREDLKKRFDTLEAFIQKEVDSLGQRLKSEKAERTESLKELTHEQRDAAKALEKKIGQLDDQFAEATAGLRAALLEQFKSLTAEIQSKHRDLSALLERELQVLRVEKTDRAALADMLTEIAVRLKEELTLPEGK